MLDYQKGQFIADVLTHIYMKHQQTNLNRFKRTNSFCTMPTKWDICMICKKKIGNRKSVWVTSTKKEDWGYEHLSCVIKRNKNEKYA